MAEEKHLSGKSNDIAVARSADQYQVVLPCDVKDFGEFVSGLLGKPQILKGRVAGNFEVQYRDVANIYHLVSHRVSQQNQGHLLHLSVTVYYDNGTSIKHNNIERFKDYHPTEKTRPIEIVLVFTYLLLFPQANAPEKQTVEISLSTEPTERRQWRPWHHGGLFEYSIEYTDRTWATDIAGLLRNHGKVLVEEHSKVREFFRTHTDELVEYTGVLVAVATLVFWLFHSLSYLDSIGPSITSDREVFLSATKYLLGSGVVLIILALALYSVKRYAEYHLHVVRSSYILLVDADRKHKEQQTAKEKKQWASVIAALFMNVCAGLIAHHIISSGYLSFTIG